MKLLRLLAAGVVLATLSAHAADDDVNGADKIFAGLKFRELGPAITSGRITDFAMHPERWQEYFAATASGGLWKTTDNGTTWKPVFDNEASYSIGVVELDPTDPLTVWVGTGENNSQRSVAYGDGVYKSIDGGRTWKNVGLKDSEHIGQIRFHPDDSDTVYVAAQGPLWNDGGDRGLYRTTDGGENWDKILDIDQYTGVNELVIHPEHPERMLASSYQRRRHTWTLINGGPGSGIHKSTDGGETWREITAGLPAGDKGRIGLAMAPSNPDMVYAIVEAEPEHQGVYRSTDFGESWEKRSDYMSSSPQYYNELVVDPHNPERVYSLDTFARMSEDGGKTFPMLSIEHRHVDDHALWIDPDYTAHLIIGGDGGIYESWDRGQTWRHMQNLPITQFYRATPDNAEPFYHVYGGTQDNNTLGAPSRTTNVHGITNSDWLLTLGGDGFKPQIDPTDHNIVYSQYQYGNLARYDRRTGERVFITPQPDADEDQLRWNWNSPLIISHHDPARLYYGSEMVFRSDDRGNSWQRISDDLSRDLDRNQMEVMGRIWSVDSISKNRSTSMYGSLISITESPFDENLLYTGSDDGLIHVTTDGGENWRRISRVAGVPEQSLVEDIITSVHDADVAYAVFDNHKKGDFKPYVYITRDRGRSWRSISGNLPERGTVHTIAEDHVDPNLLFVGTEFGVFATQDGGRNWIQLKGGGFPTIAVRDLEIQRREQDLVVATFGRGIWVLDDYTPLRTSADTLNEDNATLFASRPAWLFIEGDKWGSREKGSQGASFYTAKNPAFGAVFTYYLKDGVKSRKEQRREEEKKTQKDGGDNPYPSWDELRVEDRELKPAVYVIVEDSNGETVSRISGPVAKGLHRVNWNLRLPAPDPVQLGDAGFKPPWASDPVGPLALPGTYTATLAKVEDGKWTQLAAPTEFEVRPLDQGVVVADRQALQRFQIATARLQRAVSGAIKASEEIQSRIDHLQQALLRTPAADDAEFDQLRSLESRLDDIVVALRGDNTRRSRSMTAPWSIEDRVDSVVFGHWESQSPVTQTHRRAYELAAASFGDVLGNLKSLRDDLVSFEAAADRQLAPWTPGRIPDWSAE